LTSRTRRTFIANCHLPLMQWRSIRVGWRSERAGAKTAVTAVPGAGPDQVFEVLSEDAVYRVTVMVAANGAAPALGTENTEAEGSLQASPRGQAPDFNAMTPEELRDWLCGAAGPLVDALAPLDEAARRMLAKEAFELFRAANDLERKSDLSKVMGDAVSRQVATRSWRAGCCDGTKARRLQLFTPHEEGILAVLLARKPAWIDGWIKHQIDKRWVPGHWWPVVRGLVRAGIASKPAPPHTSISW